MAETPSTMIPLGTKAPQFSLLDARSGEIQSLENLRAPVATVIMFICNHCPYVKHILPELLKIIPKYQSKGIQFIAISSNDATKYPQDGPEEMRLEAEKNNFSFPYLYDESQDAAKAYHAACTPDFYIFDKDLLCVYRGRFDDATPGNQRPVTGTDLIKALDHIIRDEPVNSEQIASVGCNIKWKK